MALNALLVATAIVVAAAIGFAIGSRRAGLQARRRALAHIRRLKGRIAGLEERLALSSELRAATVCAVSDGVLVIDAQHKILHANPRAQRWFDIDVDSRPSLMSAVGSAELQEAVDVALADAAPTDAATEPEATLVRCEGRVLSVRVHPRKDGGGVVALRDETELRRLARSQRDLVANVSHDLRTPLTSLSLLVDSLLSGPASREAVWGAGRRMRDQVHTLGSIADGLIEISRLESGRSLLRLEPHQLSALVAQAASSLAPQLEDSQVRVTNSVAPDIAVLADEDQIVRVFTNLVDNARRFSPEGGVVTVGSCPAAEPDRVEIYVRDEGPGIAPAEVERVFERFFRGDASRGGEGKGLGLAVTRHIVAGHGGAIWVDQALRDQGTTIRFTLPVAG